ncbi:MAG: 4-hydroxybenzoyl-CoA reductase subunit alpha, partial [Nitrospinota bacterium]
MVIEHSVVGRRLPMIDGKEKVSGGVDYIADMTLPGMLHGKILRSPHPHARILDIDTSAAERVPGVRAVLTGRNRPQTRFGISVPEIISALGDVDTRIRSAAPTVTVTKCTQSQSEDLAFQFG